MLCEKCGKQNKEGDRFCQYCGNKFEQKPIEQANDSKDFIWKEWKLDGLIGEGSFGKVYKAKREEYGETYYSAIKIISIPQNASEIQAAKAEGMDDNSLRTYFQGFVTDWVKEIKLMESLKATQNIVSIEDYKVIEQTNKVGWEIAIRMELLTSLNSYITNRALSKYQVIQLGIDVCKALEFCQKMNIIHRDIKPENIFVSKFGDFKLGDFGVARQIERTTSGLSKKGTYTYMAPEVYLGGAYNSSVDIYSLGMVLYRFLNNNRTAFLPNYPNPITFQDRENSTARRMGGEQLPPPIKAEGRLASIVLKACAFNPKDRYDSPTAMREDLEAALQSEKDVLSVFPIVDSSQMKSKTEAMDPSNRTESVFGATSSAFAADHQVENATELPEATAKPEMTENPGVTKNQEIADNPSMNDSPAVGEIFPSSEPSINITHNITENFTDNSIYDSPEPTPEPKKKRRKALLLAGIMVVLLSVLGISAFAFGMVGGDNVKVPDVVGQSSEEAVLLMEDSGLVVTVTEVLKKDKTIGQIFAQSIEAGEKVEAGTKIELKVAIGAKEIIVPNVVGLTENAAMDLIKKEGFSGSVVSQFSDKVETGIVIAQSSVAGEKKNIGTNIELLVSKGKEPVTVASTWSSWTAALPNGVTSTDYYIESKTQYQSRDKELTTSSASTLSGWTKYNETYTWGGWSSWSSNAVSASATREVNTKQVANPQTYKTVYRYNRFVYVNGATYYSFSSGLGFPGNWQYIELSYPLNVTGYYEGHNSYGSYGSVAPNLWFNQSTAQIPQPITYHTEYQYRDRITTYHYYRFTAWSAWQDTPISVTASKEVATRKLYRYKEK